MPDLWECLVQIKALAETPKRLAELARQAPPPAWTRRPQEHVWAPIEVLAHLADAELFHASRLRLMLTAERPILAAWDQEDLARRAGYVAWPPERALARFCERREANLELLERCSADDLARVGVHPRRGAMTVADLVALMLAHDTAHVGQIRQRLGLVDHPTQAS